MRLLTLLVLLFPLSCFCQINRSANELAREKIREYVSGKLFKEKNYESVSFSDIRQWEDSKSEILWTINHRFDILSPQDFNSKPAERIRYNFIFYLDRRMKILKAESTMSY